MRYSTNKIDGITNILTVFVEYVGLKILYIVLLCKKKKCVHQFMPKMKKIHVHFCYCVVFIFHFAQKKGGHELKKNPFLHENRNSQSGFFIMWRNTACTKLESARVVEKTRNDITKRTQTFSSKSQSVHEHMDITVKYAVYEIFFQDLLIEWNTFRVVNGQ